MVDAGSLFVYTPSQTDLLRRSALVVHKILKGAKPADLPVEQPTKFALVINMKTAKALSAVEQLPRRIHTTRGAVSAICQGSDRTAASRRERELKTFAVSRVGQASLDVSRRKVWRWLVSLWAQ